TALAILISLHRLCPSRHSPSQPIIIFQLFIRLLFLCHHHRILLHPTSTTTPTPSFFTPTYVQPPPPFIQPPSRPTTTTPTLPHPPAWTDIFFAHTRSHSSSSSLSKPPESPTPPPMRRWPSLASFRSSSTTSTTSFQRLGMMSRSGSTRPFTPSTHDIQEEGILNDPPQRRRAFSRLSILNRSFTPPPQAQPEVSSKRWSIFSKPIRPHLDEPSPLQRTSIQINPEDQEPPLTSPKKRFSWKVSTDSIFPLRRRQSTATISSTHDTPTPTTTDATQPSLFRTASTRLSIMMSRTSIISTTTITEQPRQKLGPLRLLSRRLKNHPDPPPPSPSTPRPSMAYTDVESDTYTMEEALQLAAGVSRRSLSITTIPASRRSSLSVSTTSQPILEALKIAFSSDRPQFFGEQVPPRIAATPRTSMSQTSPVDTPLQRVGSVSTVHRKSVIVNHGNTGHWFVTPAPSIAWGEESYKTALDVARQATTISERVFLIFLHPSFRLRRLRYRECRLRYRDRGVHRRVVRWRDGGVRHLRLGGGWIIDDGMLDPRRLLYALL
ncbi:hypothetical protein BC829DRAFT_457063, partial [Chytridium lagenaria]